MALETELNSYNLEEKTLILVPDSKIAFPTASEKCMVYKYSDWISSSKIKYPVEPLESASPHVLPSLFAASLKIDQEQTAIKNSIGQLQLEMSHLRTQIHQMRSEACNITRRSHPEFDIAANLSANAARSSATF